MNKHRQTATTTLPNSKSSRAKKALPFLLLCGLATSAMAQISLNVQPLGSFSPNGDGWLTPAENSFLTTGTSSTERGMAFNPVNNHIYITSRVATTTTFGIQVIDATTGATVGNLNTSGISGGGGGQLNMISVTSDGIIYAGNLSTAAIGISPFKLYRWGTEGDAPSVVSYSLSGLVNSRLGDNMDIIGSDALGTTRIVAGYSGTNGYAIINPIDFTSSTVLVGTANSFRGGVSFVDNDTVWGISALMTAGGLTRSEISGTLSGTMNVSNTLERPMDIVELNGVWLMATVEVANNTTDNCDVRIYDITDSVNFGGSARTLLGTYNLVGTPYIANPNTAGSITWGTPNGNDITLYAMSTNNGIQAFDITLVPEPGSAALMITGLGLLAGRRRRA